MNSNRIKGIIPPTLTVFKSDEKQEIDEEKIRWHLNFLVEEGVHGIFPTGSSGEYPYLSFEEHKRVIEISVDAINGRIPVIAGVGNPGTKNTVELAKHAEDVGADAVIATTPYYFKLSDEELYMHYKTLSESVNLPVFIYNVPGLTGYEMSISVIDRLVEGGYVQGIKESSHEISKISEVVARFKGKIVILVGNAARTVPMMLLGTDGAVVSHGNSVPNIFVDLWKAVTSKDYARAIEIHYKLLPLWNFGWQPGILKEILTLRGHPMGHARRPQLPLSQGKIGELRKILTNLGVL